MYDDMLYQTLSARIEYLEKIIAKKEVAFAHAPEGHLRFSTRGKQVYYFHRTDPKDLSGVYIKRSEIKKACALAQKDYDRKVLQSAKEELKALKLIMNSVKKDKLEMVFDKMPVQRQVLVTPAAISDAAFADEWQKIPYEAKPFSESGPEFYTGRGERVRSKTEILIADTLARYNVPYRYECPIKTRELGIIYPDFTALKVIERRAFIWEHFGMMDNPEYARKALKRIEILEQNGYFPGKNLIITYETEDSPIKTKLIAKMIETYLL